MTLLATFGFSGSAAAAADFHYHGWTLHEVDPVESPREIFVGGGRDCRGAKAEAQNFAVWTKHLGETPGKPATCRCTTSARLGKTCDLDIANIVPAATRLLNDRSPRLNGPNCFNTSLVVSKIIPNLLFSAPSQMDFWLHSPLCRPVDVSSLAPGDIEVIRSRDGQTIHSFVLVDQNYSFSKSSSAKAAPYSLHVADWEYVYNIPQNCRQLDLSKGQIVPTHCPNSSSLYRCQSMALYRKGIPALSSSFLETDGRLDTLESQISEFTFHALKAPTPNTQSELVRHLQDILSDVSENLRDTTRSDAELFLWRSLEQRAASALSQIQQWNEE